MGPRIHAALSVAETTSPRTPFAPGTWLVSIILCCRSWKRGDSVLTYGHVGVDCPECRARAAGGPLFLLVRIFTPNPTGTRATSGICPL